MESFISRHSGFTESIVGGVFVRFPEGGVVEAEAHEDICGAPDARAIMPVWMSLTIHSVDDVGKLWALLPHFAEEIVAVMKTHYGADDEVGSEPDQGDEQNHQGDHEREDGIEAVCL